MVSCWGYTAPGIPRLGIAVQVISPIDRRESLRNAWLAELDKGAPE